MIDMWIVYLPVYIHPIFNCNILIHIYNFSAIQWYHYRSNTKSIVTSSGEINISWVKDTFNALQYKQINSTHALHVCVHKCTGERVCASYWVMLQWHGATNIGLGILSSWLHIYYIVCPLVPCITPIKYITYITF